MLTAGLKSVDVLNFINKADELLFSICLLLQEMPHTDEFMDDSTVCGIRYNKTLAPSPKSIGDFTSAAQLSSTPFHKFPADPLQIPEDKGECSTIFCKNILFVIVVSF